MASHGRTEINYTNGKRFLDTNVLFYSCDTSDAIKHQKALDLIADCSRDNSGVLSVQVLGEFFHATVVRKKLLTAEEAERVVMAFRSSMKCASIEPQDVFDAVEVHRRYQTRYWVRSLLRFPLDSNVPKYLARTSTTARPIWVY